jgi:hypothetical protein
MNTLEIRLTKNRNPADDDIITVRKRHGRSDYLFKYSEAGNPRTSWVQEKEVYEVLEYIERLFTCLLIDVDPPKCIQVNIPSCPMFMFTHASFTQTVADAVMESIHDFYAREPLILHFSQ